MDSSRPPRLTSSRHDLVHPIPQRRYAFVMPHDDSSLTGTGMSPPPTGNTASTEDFILRPVSAPAGMTPDFISIARPSSPLSRVGNPMVRDGHFRRFASSTANHHHHNDVNSPHVHSHLHTYASTPFSRARAPLPHASMSHGHPHHAHPHALPRTQLRNPPVPHPSD